MVNTTEQYVGCEWWCFTSSKVRNFRREHILTQQKFCFVPPNVHMSLFHAPVQPVVPLRTEYPRSQWQMKDPLVFSQFPFRQMFGFSSHSSTSRQGEGNRQIKNVGSLNKATIKERLKTIYNSFCWFCLTNRFDKLRFIKVKHTINYTPAIMCAYFEQRVIIKWVFVQTHLNILTSRVSRFCFLAQWNQTSKWSPLLSQTNTMFAIL